MTKYNLVEIEKATRADLMNVSSYSSFYYLTVPTEKGIDIYVFPINHSELGSRFLSNRESPKHIMPWIRKAFMANSIHKIKQLEFENY